MVIDNENKYVLTNYKTARKTGKAIDSDHKTEYMDLDLKIKHEKPIRKEIFNFKDKKAQAELKKITSITQDFTNCFKKELPVDKQIEMGRKVLKKYYFKAFKKIRITGGKLINKNIAKLINQRNELQKMTN